MGEAEKGQMATWFSTTTISSTSFNYFNLYGRGEEMERKVKRVKFGGKSPLCYARTLVAFSLILLIYYFFWLLSFEGHYFKKLKKKDISFVCISKQITL